VALRTLKPEEAGTIEAIGETLVPDARKAGIANFIDHQISIPAEEALLEARILNVRPPYANFYRAAIGAIDRASQARSGKRFADLDEAAQREFVDLMRQNKIEGWQGPAGPFVYLVLRSDAVDVVYGTMAGYEALGRPYMAHIAPTRRW
jgi:Gluconate 2-dehydrogenase subunit 3